jgi:hypothetical protein
MPDPVVPGEFDVVMPFVVTTSNGGNLNDEAYVLGWDAACIDQMLGQAVQFGTVTLARYVNTKNLPQLDLVAMRHGLRMVAEPEDEQSDEWCWVTFTNVEEETPDA